MVYLSIRKVSVFIICPVAAGLFAWGAFAANYYEGMDNSGVATDAELKPTGIQVASNVNVAVIGKKFRWTFRYPGPDGVLHTDDDVDSDRKLLLPPGVHARFKITSEDYVYILGIPIDKNSSNSNAEESGKIREIAVPDMFHFIDHQFETVGTYDLMVDPLCGFQAFHDPKMGQIVVTDRQDFSLLFPTDSGKTVLVD